MINLNVQNETSRLNSVLVGTANSFGGVPKIRDCYDPKSKEHVISGHYPKEVDLVNEIENFCTVLEKYNIKVYRPDNILGLNQIFSRDIAFVIEDKLVLPNIISNRQKEADAIKGLVSMKEDENIIRTSSNVRIEGGDVILCNDFIFVGYSEEQDFEQYTVARTNKSGLDFLISNFPAKVVKGFELNKSDLDAKENALHLDCCFQPIGKKSAILYRAGFKRTEDVEFIINYFGKDNIIEITKDEMYHMCSNIFSISESVLVSEKGFIRLNNELRKRGFIVEEIPYAETAKMEGLLRCSTMPLIRE